MVAILVLLDPTNWPFPSMCTASSAEELLTVVLREDLKRRSSARKQLPLGNPALLFIGSTWTNSRYTGQVCLTPRALSEHRAKIFSN